MLYYLDGFVDAGAAGRQLTTHLLSTLEHTEIARFDVDSLIDYRSRRPAMIFTKDHWESVEEPEITCTCSATSTRHPFLLLNGLEPDREWEAFTRAVLDLSAALKVRLVASFHGIPMGVPHTRPLGITGHATKPELIDGYQPLVDRLQVPGSAIGADRVPDGRGRARPPSGSPCTCRTIWRTPPTRPRRSRCSRPWSGRPASTCRPRRCARPRSSPTPRSRRQVEGSEEVTEVVRSLEEQYDAFNADTQDLLAGQAENMPTADELGAQFERFLAEQQYGGEGTPES